MTAVLTHCLLLPVFAPVLSVPAPRSCWPRCLTSRQSAAATSQCMPCSPPPPACCATEPATRAHWTSWRGGQQQPCALSPPCCSRCRQSTGATATPAAGTWRRLSWLPLQRQVLQIQPGSSSCRGCRPRSTPTQRYGPQQRQQQLQQALCQAAGALLGCMPSTGSVGTQQQGRMQQRLSSLQQEQRCHLAQT